MRPDAYRRAQRRVYSLFVLSSPLRPDYRALQRHIHDFPSHYGI